MSKFFRIEYHRTNFINAERVNRIRFCFFDKIRVSFNLSKIFKSKIHKALITHCDIENLDYILAQNPIFTHIIGIVINKNVKIGKNCIIRQNVTIGNGKFYASTNRQYPVLGNNVNIGAGAIIIGGITIGNDVTIGAGSIVVKDVPDGATVAGNPAKIIRQGSKPVIAERERVIPLFIKRNSDTMRKVA